MKKKKLTKTLAVLLVMMVVLFMLPVSSFAADGAGTSQAVYLDGENGNDENSGVDSVNAVKTLEKAMELAVDDGVIYICGQVTIEPESESTITVSDITIERAAGYEGTLIVTAGIRTGETPVNLTLRNVTIDGNRDDVQDGEGGYLLMVGRGSTVRLEAGTVLKDNRDTAINVGQATDSQPRGSLIIDGAVITGNGNESELGGGYYGSSGGAIYNGGYVEMISGEISNNAAESGGAICNNAKGEIILNGGEIKNNTALYQGGAIMTSYGTITLNGASITGNKTGGNGGGIFLQSVSQDDDAVVLNMLKGEISGNLAGAGGYVGSAIFGDCVYSDDVIINISGGTIAGGEGDRRIIALLGDTADSYPTLNLSGNPNIAGSIFLWDGAYEPGYQINVTGEFEPEVPIAIERQNSSSNIVAVNYTNGVIPDANDFAAYNLTDILVVNGQTMEWREGKAVYFYDTDGTEYTDYRHGVITGGTIDTANVPAVQKDGYTFMGWIAKDETEYWDFAADTVTDTTELYAAWSLNAPTVTITADNTEVHEGTSAALTAAPAHDAANVSYTYQWYKDGAAIAGATESTIAAAESGSYTVKVTATDGTNTSVEAESNAVEIKVENHTFSTLWKNDADNHWHECSICGEKADIAAHIFAWVTDREATETAAGLRHEQCTICGYAKAAVEIPATGTQTDTETLTDDNQTTDTAAPTGDSQTTDTATPAGDSRTGETTAPGTGDNSNIAFWIAVMLVAVAALTGTALYNQKKKYNK